MLKHGIFDVAVRESIEPNKTLAKTLIPLLDARLVLYKTYLKLDNQAKAQVGDDPVCQCFIPSGPVDQERRGHTRAAL